MVTILPDERCKKVPRYVYNTSTMLCVGDYDNGKVNVRQGDSGGPLGKSNDFPGAAYLGCPPRFVISL